MLPTRGAHSGKTVTDLNVPSAFDSGRNVT